MAQIVSSTGNRLQLDISMLYLWCADYKTGSPDTTLGECGLDFESYDAAMLDSLDGVIDAVRGIYRPDGQHAVSIMYLDGEVMTAVDDGDPATDNEKANQRWFLLNYYPTFSREARGAGIIPSIYFLTAGTEDKMLDNDFQVGFANCDRVEPIRVKTKSLNL